MAKKNTNQTLKAAAGRGGKGKKKKGGLKRGERANIVRNLGGETNPQDLWRRSTAPQRQRWRRIARKRGVTVQGLLSGGAAALQERSPSGLRREARRTIDTAYKSAETEINERELKARNLKEKQDADSRQYDMWMAGEQAKLAAQAKASDEALQLQQQQAGQMEQAAWQEAAQHVGVDVGASNPETGSYGQRQVALAGASAIGGTAARARADAQRAATGQGLRSQFAQSTMTASVNARHERDSEFYSALREIGSDRKKLLQDKAGAMAKEIASLRTQQSEIAVGNREARMLGQELGIKQYQAVQDAKNDRAKNRLNWAKYKADLTDDQLRRALDRAKLKLAQGDLSRKERADAERARHNLQMELNARRKGGGSNEATAGEKKVWGIVEDGRSRATNYMRKTGDQSQDGVTRYLRTQGFDPVTARAAAELVTRGGVSRQTRARLRDSGGWVPPKWRK